MDTHAISFGPFRLLAGQRILLEGDNPVRLGSRAFDILAALVERAGEVVEKQELISRAWPQTFVEDANLKIQVSALRRALGDGQGGHRYVLTVPGRGYNFVAPVKREERSRVPSAPTAAPSAMHNLPFAATRMIGREDVVAVLVSHLSRQRLVTIIGPGGIGKTTVALAVAERMVADFVHGVWLIDLAPVGDPRLVPTAVATVLGLEVRAEEPLPDLVSNLKDKRMLLLLDNCEHVIDEAVNLTTAVLSGAAGVNILATSREPLGVAGEREYRLRALSTPQSAPGLTAAEAGGFPAVQLFVVRATAILENFALTDANAPLVGEICRKLDGLPLAIEFAAPRVAMLGVEGLAARLDDKLPLLGSRRRTATPRHQTMGAVLDWSYGLLSDEERLFFRALGIFSGGFSAEAAAAAATGAASKRVDAIDRLADLVAKSLVVADCGSAETRFRLLDTTRAYAIEKLDERGERERIARRHAEYYRTIFECAEREALTRPTKEWLADYAHEIDNLRAALDSAFSSGGGDIGVALTAAAVPLWMYLSLIEECRRRVNRALTALVPAAGADARLEMKLQAALAASLAWVGGASTEMASACTRTLELAERLGDADYQLRALWGLWHVRDQGAVALAERFAAVASTPADRLVGDQMIGNSYHFQGNQGSARQHLERVVANLEAVADPGSRIIRFQVDQQPMQFLARVLWLQGLAEQAMAMAARLVEHAKADDHANSLCQALGYTACPIALWVGDLDLAERYIAHLLETARRHELTLWNAVGRAHRGVHLIKRGDLRAGLPELRAAFEECRVVPAGYRVLMFIAELPEALGRAGQVSEALATVDEAIGRADRTADGWIMGELLRVKGELLRLNDAPGSEAWAEEWFRQALQLASTQEALSWELRAATSLAMLHRARRRSGDAIACLQPVYDRFTEGFATADLTAAKGLLDELSGADRR
jgi:predicted ATPase/DNA-binding winged helix-turn-helix (wHTH) protein